MIPNTEQYSYDVIVNEVGFLHEVVRHHPDLSLEPPLQQLYFKIQVEIIVEKDVKKGYEKLLFLIC